MCICISVELWYPLCVCLRVRGCVFWIELWRCAISLTSTESHSSQLNHGNRLYGQKCCFSSVCVSVCVCMCVYETPCASPCVCDCGNSPDIYYSIGICQREREVLSIHTFSALKMKRYQWCLMYFWFFLPALRHYFSQEQCNYRSKPEPHNHSLTSEKKVTKHNRTIYEAVCSDPESMWAISCAHTQVCMHSTVIKHVQSIHIDLLL